MNWLRSQISRFTEFSLLEQLFGSLAPFVLVLSHSKSDLYSSCFFGFLTLWGRFQKILRASLNRMNWLENKISRFTEFSLLEQLFGSLALFVSVLSHLESDLYFVCFVGFLTLWGRF